MNDTQASPEPRSPPAPAEPPPSSSGTPRPPRPRRHRRAGLGRGRPTDARLVHRPMPWAMGILNVLFSAVLAVVWLWIPVSLFVSGVAGVFALGFGIIFLLVWFLLQRGINHLERLRSEAVYGERIRVPQTRTTLRTGFVGWLHQQWLILTSAAFWRSTAHSLVKTMYGGTIGILLLAGLGFGTFALALAINPTFLDASDVSISNRAGLGVLGGAAIVVALLILAVSPLLDRQIDRGLLPSTWAAPLRERSDSLTHEVGARDGAHQRGRRDGGAPAHRARPARRSPAHARRPQHEAGDGPPELTRTWTRKSLSPRPTRTRRTRSPSCATWLAASTRRSWTIAASTRRSARWPHGRPCR